MVEKLLLPTDREYVFEDFLEFYEARSELLKARILDSFPHSVDEILKNHGLKP